MEIQLTEKQAEYVRNANHRWNFAIGAVRSGKSHIALQYVIPQRLRERHGKKGINLILGASRENIERNVLTPMRDIWGDTFATQINTRNIATVFGERVYCIGAENANQVSKIRGSEVKFCYCDEIVDINEDVFNMLKSRLSLPYSECHAAANPSYPNHYIKQFIDSVDKGIDVYCQHFTLYDNPFLPKEYVRSLEAEYEGTVYFKRYILGLWEKAEGLIFPMYADAITKIPTDVEPVEVVVSIDYGTQNPFAALVWYRYEGDKTWYAVKGYYYSGREKDHQKTDYEYGQDLRELLGEEIQARHDKEERTYLSQPKIRVIVDPSAASFIALLKREAWCKVVPGENTVLDGLRETATALQLGLIKINENIKEWAMEAGGYVWDDKSEDKPVKERDHYMDATRYFVKTMHITKIKRDFTPLWKKERVANVY